MSIGHPYLVHYLHSQFDVVLCSLRKHTHFFLPVRKHLISPLRAYKLNGHLVCVLYKVSVLASALLSLPLNHSLDVAIARVIALQLLRVHCRV